MLEQADGDPRLEQIRDVAQRHFDKEAGEVATNWQPPLHLEPRRPVQEPRIAPRKARHARRTRRKRDAAAVATATQLKL